MRTDSKSHLSFGKLRVGFNLTERFFALFLEHQPILDAVVALTANVFRTDTVLRDLGNKGAGIMKNKRNEPVHTKRIVRRGGYLDLQTAHHVVGQVRVGLHEDGERGL